MPLHEYVAAYCLESLYCPKRFAFWQLMNTLRLRCVLVVERNGGGVGER